VAGPPPAILKRNEDKGIGDRSQKRRYRKEEKG
jgi:hypothetical protein